MGCVCVCVRETERERGRGIFGISSVKRMWKVCILRRKIEESKGWLSSRPWSKSRGVCPLKTVYFRPTTTRHSIFLSFLIFAIFICLSKLIRTYKNWNLAWMTLISLPLIAPKEFKSISWLWADLCSCSRFPTLCHRRGAHLYQARTRGARVSAAFGGVWQNSRWRSRTKHLKMVLASSAVSKQHFGLWTRLVRTIFFLFSVSEESLRLCFPLFLPMWARVSPELQQQQE